VIQTVDEFKYSIAGESESVSDEIQALLDTPTTNWDSMSETGMDMLSDMHLSTMTDSPTVTTRHTAMQLDLIDLTETTDQTIALPQALL